mgnify:CR=1 FL=1
MAMAIDWNAARHLPWGWWLRANDSALEDMDGSRWHSVRDAFWQGRMHFPREHVVPEQMELLLRVLSAVDQRWSNGSENRHDLFGGDMMFWRFYLCWLASVGLTEPERGMSALEGPLSDEGHSVMLMLQATRDPAWVDLPMDQVVEAVRRTMLDDRHDQGAFERFERAVAFRPNVFARETVGGRHLVTLTGFQGSARMPVRRVLWSVAVDDERVRDAFFAWVADRVDRWDDYGEMAYNKGAAALTSHLFSLFLASLDG